MNVDTGELRRFNDEEKEKQKAAKDSRKKNR